MLTTRFAITTNGKTKVMTEEKALKFLMRREGLQDWEAYSILSRVSCANSVESDEVKIEKVG